MRAMKNTKLRTDGKWEVEGYDTFSNEGYSVSKHKTKKAAEMAAKRHKANIERLQPKETAGSIQDLVYLVDPKGNKVRV